VATDQQTNTQTHKQTNKQTGPIKIHCAANISSVLGLLANFDTIVDWSYECTNFLPCCW